MLINKQNVLSNSLLAPNRKKQNKTKQKTQNNNDQQ